MSFLPFLAPGSLLRSVRSIHKDIVKKTFSKEAFEMVMKSEDYTEWLPLTSVVNASLVN